MLVQDQNERNDRQDEEAAGSLERNEPGHNEENEENEGGQIEQDWEDERQDPGPAGQPESPPRREGSWVWRAGMAAYRLGAGAFFRAGGLRWLRKKYGADIDERMGVIEDVPQGGVWIHAVSVGEAQSASALIREMRKECQLPCILSTVTQTGREMAEQLLGGEAGQMVDRMIYSPWDAPRFVVPALDAIRPKVYVAMETERWPEMLSELKSRGIPAFLANGRLSEGSLKKLRPEAPFWRGVLDCFTKILVRYDEDREHFMALGVPEERIAVTGDCKVDALIMRGERPSSEWARLRRGSAPLFIAGSTHEGEEDIVIQAFRHIRKKHPGARLVIAPRHPERALMVVAAALPYPELQADLLSRLPQDWDIAVVDRIGVLFDLYAACDAAFVGGSLVPKGGQNPLEPALSGILTCHGPHMTDFPDTERMDQMGAARCVHNYKDLSDAWLAVLTPAERARVKDACRAYYDTLGGAARRTWEIIREYVEAEQEDSGGMDRPL